MSPSKRKGMTYAGSGVSIEAGDALASRLSRINPAIGGFSGAFPLELSGVREPVLVASTDGVGTKLLLAQKLKNLGTIGIDLVAMVVNDLLVCGARPLFFLDYYATAKLADAESGAVLEGIVAGCEQAGIPLIGGETAEMPGMYAPGTFDLAGFSVGLADKAALVDGSRVRPGDVLLGLASSGIHSNGYSLVRQVISESKLPLGGKPAGWDENLGDVLLRPTRIYVKAVAQLMKRVRPTAMAHITGGGIAGNLVRVLPEGCRACIDAGTWTPPPVFGLLQEAGGIAHGEMARVFNMGIGYIITVRPGDAVEAERALAEAGESVQTIGHIEGGERGVQVKGRS